MRTELRTLRETDDDECVRLETPSDFDLPPKHGFGEYCYLKKDAPDSITKRYVTDVGRWNSLSASLSHAETLMQEAESIEVVSKETWPENEGGFSWPEPDPWHVRWFGWLFD